MYSREFLLCCCSYLNVYGESEKQTHFCQTIELSDYWTNGLSDYSYAPVQVLVLVLAVGKLTACHVL